jgi:hypothetical protein
MPTDKQLFDSWRAQDILGLSHSQYYCNDHSPEPVNERNYNSNENASFTGEEFGASIYKPKTDEIKMFIYKSRGKK